MKVLVFDFPGVTAQQYDRLRAALSDGKPLTNLADFRRVGYAVVSHIVATTPDGLRIIDVWESEEAIERFRQKLMPLLERAGIPAAAPVVLAVHDVVTR